MDVPMDNTAGCNMYSLMDGSSGYNQVGICLSDAEKIAFRTPIGNFYYVIMSFGLKNLGLLIKESWWQSFMILSMYILKFALMISW
ncbi:hypothetical protein SLA2020_056310 [Shorea laevis]